MQGYEQSRGPEAPSEAGAHASPAATALSALDVEAYLEEARALIIDEIRAIVPRNRRGAGRLYELMLDYPLRAAKALRPALCIASCRALGGRTETVLRSAAVLELYHNAFLIHDDVEDDSEKRRGSDTLHRAHGVPIAVNVGDGMLALALQPLLDNMASLGMGKALRILKTVGEMARATAEGQAMELAWIRAGRWDQHARDYVRMVYKKSAWYSFVTPVALGAICAGASATATRLLQQFATLLGVAFQIQDDVLNLTAREQDYGKEILGDLWEGKHTLILLHALQHAGDAERERAVAILRKPRTSEPSADPARLAPLLDALTRDGELSVAGRHRLEMACATAAQPAAKTADDVAFLATLVERAGSIAFARSMARRRAERALRTLAAAGRFLRPSVHHDFMRGLATFVVERNW